MKKDNYNIAFVFARNRGDSSVRFGGFARRLQNNGHLNNCNIKTIALEDIVFRISSKSIELLINGEDQFIDLDFVYFKSWESLPEIAGALASALKARGIPFIDQSVSTSGFSKLPMMVRFSAANVPIARSLYAMHLQADHVEEYIGLPCIIKAVHGQKGRDNHLITTGKELKEFVSSHDISNYLVQEFIANDGDYRIWVYGGKVRGGLYRKASGDTHLNNTSAGAEAELLDDDSISRKLSDISIAAAAACSLSISGVDVIKKTDSEEYYVIEANQGSQVVTGAYIDVKMKAFADGIEELLEKRYTRKKTPMSKLDVVGRHVAVNFPDWGIDGMIGKVDTGAYQPALHAVGITEDEAKRELTFTIEEFEDKDGRIHPSNTIKTDNYSFAEVRNTSGKLEKRYLVPVRFSIRGRVFNSKVSLTNRGSMKYPLLIGRRTLRGRFLVNSELSKRTSL